MNKFYLFLFSFAIIPLLLFLKTDDKKNASPTVEIKKTKSGYKLFRNDTRYYIKGAGGFTYLENLKRCGGNSIRLWTTEGAKEYLDEANKLGLTVSLGIFMEPERHGFNYSDKEKVKKQFEEIKKQILIYKDHPALLLWGVGNELDLYAKNYNVWNAVNDVVRFIHEVDPNHPTTTTLAGADIKHVKEIIKRCPQLDFLSVNAYKDLPYVKNKIAKAGWTGPYLISEWGASGYWESDTVPWGSFIEETSTQKAKIFEERYKVIIADTNHCLGSYVYYWGSKQERTHTVLSLFLVNGEQTEPVDALQKLWSGKTPANKSPYITPIIIDQKDIRKGIYLKPSEIHIAFAEANDPDGDALTYHWEIYHESTEKKQGGDNEKYPAKIEGLVIEENGNKISFKAPDKEGPYRLFVYAFDGKNHATTANAPFYVTK